MADSAFIPQSSAGEQESQHDRGTIIIQTRIRRSIWKIAFATLLLMAVGSATRVMNAGLACPDWPLCYGQLVPTQQMNLQVFLEWFHRLDAGLIGLSTLLLAGSSWWYRHQLPRWLPWATTFALSLILVQGALGAFTVTELLRFDIVTAHLGTALLFFITLLSIGTCLLPQSPTPPIPNSSTPIIPLTAAILVYIQSILGGLVGSRWALHQCFGNSELCTVMNNHLFGVIPATLSCIAVIIAIWRNPNSPKYCGNLAASVGGLLIAQILLGTATFRLHFQVETLTVAHQSIGAMLLGTLVILTALLWRQNNFKTSNHS
ncbi:heme A synthase [Chamaesiphon sp. VAR_48_metabat_135_sub]|uniref:COX15/CtaA family protein n=1 Tax=Chamaesiphon sp. VAR_48_metabat_135_sub TaxID=2964699 RepID=UPI002869ED00|nr:heme A synthase [Chamaesiphon sp. VAR_48_metabat_135_sub]